MLPTRRMSKKNTADGVSSPAWFAEQVQDRPSGLGLTRFGIGTEEVAAGQVFPRRRLPDLVLVLTLEGECLTLTAEGRWHQAPGTLLVLAPHTPFQERVKPQAAWRSIYWMFQGTILAEHPMPGRVAFFEVAPPEAAAALHQGMDLAARGGAGNHLRLQALGLQILAWVGELESPGMDLVSRVRHLIRKAPQGPWALEDLAKACRLPTHTLARRFRQITGETAASWVRRQRLEMTLPGLLQGRSVKDLALSHGFADPFHYSKAFKAVFGVPPSAYCAYAAAAQRRYNPSKV